MNQYNLRGRIAETVKPIVREYAPNSLVDLWGREQVMVSIPLLEFTSTSKNYVSAEGKVRLQFIAERPDGLPNETLWKMLNTITLKPVDVDNRIRVLYLKLASVTEYIDNNLWIQDLDFNLKFDLSEC